MTAEAARALEVGDEVVLSGRVLAAREAAHRYLARRDDREVGAVSRGAVVYHCSPIVARDPRSGSWRVVAAGPAPSIAQEPFEAEVLARYGFRGILGEGGMGPRTLAALQKQGAVYLHALGDLAIGLARHVRRIEGVHALGELGPADAIWSLEVEEFPAVVTMDAHGRSWHTMPAEAPGAALR